MTIVVKCTYVPLKEPHHLLLYSLYKYLIKLFASAKKITTAATTKRYINCT